MRILICNWRDLTHPRAGGAEHFTHEVARRWVAAGHSVTQFSGSATGRPETDERDGVRLIRRGGRAGVYRAARSWYRATGRGQFDLVIDEVNTRPFQCHRWVSDAAVVALVHQVCREIWFTEMNAVAAAAGRWLVEPHWLRSLAGVPVLTVSPSSAESLRSYGLSDITTVGVGMTMRRRPEVRREARPTVVFLGRLAANKGPDDALQAHRLLLQQRPDAQMWVIGDGPERNRLERAFGDTATFLGRIPATERDERLARAHVCVVTSVREGWCLVVDEAAAMGTPTVGYDRPGLRDSIPAAGGVLVRPDPHSLAQALAAGLPEWTRNPATDGWAGGARDWDDVADEILAKAAERIGRRAHAMTASGPSCPPIDDSGDLR